MINFIKSLRIICFVYQEVGGFVTIFIGAILYRRF